jgi:MFS family permease
MLALLIAVGVVAWVDRNVLAILLEAVKVEFALSDTQLGLLGGFAFGVFYAAFGLPVAWLADRFDRTWIIACALLLWSVMTAVCGTAAGFASLFAARVGVGVGEAGASPPAQSLISDYFPPDRRAFALGVFYMYIPLGFVAGFLAGGWLNELVGWRASFLVVGLPGIVLAALVKLTLCEPPRGYSEQLADTGCAPSLRSTLRWCRRTRSMRHLPLAGAAHGTGAFAAAVWLPSYLMRSFDIGSGQAGTWMALAYGLGGGIGVFGGGWIADRLVRRTRDQRWYAWGCASVVAASVPFWAIVFLTDEATVAVAALLVATLLGHMYLGPVTAMMQGLAGPRRRAVVAALYLFLVNLVSMALGPVAVGVASDGLGSTLDGALGYSLLTIISATSLWAAVHFRLAARTLRGDLAAVPAAGPR